MEIRLSWAIENKITAVSLRGKIGVGKKKHFDSKENNNASHILTRYEFITEHYFFQNLFSFQFVICPEI